MVKYTIYWKDNRKIQSIRIKGMRALHISIYVKGNNSLPFNIYVQGNFSILFCVYVHGNCDLLFIYLTDLIDLPFPW